MNEIKKGAYYRSHIYKDTLYFGHESYDKGQVYYCKMRLSILWCSKAKYIGQGVPHQANIKPAYYESFYEVTREDALKFMAEVEAK